MFHLTSLVGHTERRLAEAQRYLELFVPDLPEDYPNPEAYRATYAKMMLTTAQIALRTQSPNAQLVIGNTNKIIEGKQIYFDVLEPKYQGSLSYVSYVFLLTRR